jgi:hypothetical protein
MLPSVLDNDLGATCHPAPARLPTHPPSAANRLGQKVTDVDWSGRCHRGARCAAATARSTPALLAGVLECRFDTTMELT